MLPNGAEFDPILESLNLNSSDHPSSSQALHDGNEQTFDHSGLGFLPPDPQPSLESFPLGTDLSTSLFLGELQYSYADEHFGLDGLGEWLADYDQQGTHSLQNPPWGL